MYSLLLTKRLDILKKELEESGESLINSLHGHGSQCLINLMLCGIATSNVFDGDKELDGLSKLNTILTKVIFISFKIEILKSY